MAGTYDAQGVWMHDEADTFPATSEVLNRGQRSISDALVPLAYAAPQAQAAAAAAQAAQAAAEAAALITVPLIAPLDEGTAALIETPGSATETALSNTIAEAISGEPGFDIVLLCGQSNMSGWATDWNTATDPLDPSLFQFATSGTNADKIVQATIPLAAVDTPAGISPGFEFARWYKSAVKGNRRLLIVPVSKGGAPFEGASSPAGWTWKVSRSDVVNLANLTVTQAQKALAAAGANARLAGVLWVQGETDGDNLSTGATYQTNLLALIDHLRVSLASPTLPFVVGQMVPEYLATGIRYAINDIHKTIQSLDDHTAFAWGPFGGNMGDGNHYNANGARKLGRTLFDALLRATANTADPALPASPAAVTGTTAGTPGTTTVPLTWDAVPGAGAYYVERSVSPFTAWTRVATPTANSVTVTGLTASTAYGFRVRAINNTGFGALPTPGYVTATTTAVAPLVDSFNRADSTTALGTPSDAGGAWSYLDLGAGAFGISTNRAYMATPTDRAKAIRTVGVADTKVSCSIPTLTWTGTATATENAGLVLAADTNNYVTATWNADGSMRFYKRISGGYTQVGTTTAAGTITVGSTVELRKSGTSVTVTVGGVNVLTVTVADAAVASVPFAGIRNAGTLVKFWDDYAASAA